VRHVILQIDVSLDGFMADANGTINWVTSTDEMNQEASDLLSTADTILLGRVAYQDFVQYWPFANTNAPTLASKIASQINHATKIVFSRTLTAADWGAWNNARVVHSGIADEIARLKALPGKHLLLYAGAGHISTFARLGLIDEYRLRVHPVVLGAGLPLFQGLNDALKLTRVSVTPYTNGAVMLTYRPVEKERPED